MRNTAKKVHVQTGTALKTEISTRKREEPGDEARLEDNSQDPTLILL